MTERYGYGYGDELSDSDLPVSRRGAVTERHHDREPDDADVREIDLTDDGDDRDRDDRDRDRDGRADAELTDEEGERPRAAGTDDQAAHEEDAGTAQFTQVDGDSEEAAPAIRSAYGDADGDAGPRPDLPADQAGAPGFDREERDLGPPDSGTTAEGDGGDRDVESGPDLVDAERPAGGGAVSASRGDLNDEGPAWSRSTDTDHTIAERGDEVEFATPTPDPASPPGPGPSGPLAPALSTDVAAGTAAPDDASAVSVTDLVTVAAATPAAATALLASVDAEAVRRQFLDIQAGFVDEPRQAVQRAGELVDDLVRQVTQSLMVERDRLQGSLGADEASTEDLRLAMRAYRAYVDRLLGLTM